MITLKSPREIEAMRQAGAIIAELHIALRDIIKPGLDIWKIEAFSRDFIESRGAIPSELGFEGYEYATTISINDEVAHAMPRKGLILNEGDIVTVDTVVEIGGGMADSAWTFAVGQISDDAQRLVDVAKKALYIGIEQAVVGNRLGDIGAAIEKYVTEENGMGNVKQYTGHGIGPTMHEEPQVLHYGTAGRGLRLKEGMTLAIEPMVNLGGWEVETSTEDGWTVRTIDGSLSAQFEHTVAITKDGPKILTSQDPEFDAKYL